MAGLSAAGHVAVDYDLLFDRLRELALSEELRAEMGRAGRRRVLDLFDWPVVIQKMETLWRELKRQALSAPRAGRENDPLGMGFQTLFGHFFTARLTEKHVISTGLMAEEFLLGRYPKNPMPTLSRPPIQEMIRILAVIREAGGRLSYGEIIETLKGELPILNIQKVVLWG